MQSPTLTQQPRQLGNEAGAIPNVRLFRPSERALTDDIASLLKQQPQRLTFDKRRQQATGMIEVQMRQDHVGDVIRIDAKLTERSQQNVIFFDDTKATA